MDGGERRYFVSPSSLPNSPFSATSVHSLRSKSRFCILFFTFFCMPDPAGGRTALPGMPRVPLPFITGDIARDGVPAFDTASSKPADEATTRASATQTVRIILLTPHGFDPGGDSSGKVRIRVTPREIFPKHRFTAPQTNVFSMNNNPQQTA